MVDVTDVQGYETKYENQMSLLDDSDELPEADRDAIRRWVVHLRTNDTEIDSLGTVVGHLNRIRLSSERAHMPLTEMESVEDVNALKLHLEDVHGLSEGTIRNYMKAVRKFFLWRDVDWAEDVTIGPPPKRKHDPADEITSEELDAMLEACNDFDAASREKALIALLRDTGLRIGAVLSFQLKHVNFEGRRGTITINEEANVKDADGPKPVTWSRAYVANWLDNHPRPEDPEAALIHKTRGWDESEHGALRQQYAGRRIQEIAEHAGLDPERIHAHLFRGTAVSEWIRDEQMNDQLIKNRVDWSEDSREFSTYSRVTDEEFNEVVFDHYGIDSEDDQPDTSPTLDECLLCGASLRGTEDVCPSCASPISSTAQDASTQVIHALREILVESEDPEIRAAANTAIEAAENDPEYAADLLAKMDH